MIYCEDIVNITLFFFTLPRFRNHIFFPPFSAMPLLQLLQKIFFPILAMILPQLVCQFFFFFSLRALHAHGQQNWAQEIRYPVAEIQHFFSPPFSSSLSYFWLNFGNSNTEIQSLSSKSQISLNSSYNVS